MNTADCVQIARDVRTDETVAIVILSTDGDTAQELSIDAARDVARQLNTLADDWEQSKPLRRSVAVSEQLRGLDE